MKSWGSAGEAKNRVCRKSANVKTSLKDWKRAYRRLKNAPGLDEHERILYARSIAATPDERWQMNVNFLRSLDCWGRSALKKLGSNS